MQIGAMNNKLTAKVSWGLTDANIPTLMLKGSGCSKNKAKLAMGLKGCSSALNPTGGQWNSVSYKHALDSAIGIMLIIYLV